MRVRPIQSIAEGRRTAVLVVLLLTAARIAWAQKDVVLTPQQGSAWCWAAASQMVMEAVGPAADYSQARQAELVVKGCKYAPRDTCSDVNSVFAGCNRPGFPTFDRKEFGFTFKTNRSPLSWPALKEELDNGRPVVFGWCVEKHCGDTTDKSMGHWMVAVAADVCPTNNGDTPTLKVFNPAPCCKGQNLNITYATYASGIPGLKFWRNYYQIRPDSVTQPTPAPTQRAGPASQNPLQRARIALTACLPSSDRWRSSGLLRDDAIPPPLGGDDIGFGSLVERRYIPLADIGTVRVTPTADIVDGAKPPTEALTVLAVKRDRFPLANVVFIESLAGQPPVAFEDSESARRQQERVELAQKEMRAEGNATRLTEYVILETGLHFIPIPAEHRGQGAGEREHGGPDDVDAIVILSEIDCRKPKDDEAPTKLALTKLVELLTVSR